MSRELFLPRWSPRVVLRRKALRVASTEDDADRPLGIRGGEQRAHRSPLRDPEEHGTLRVAGVHDGADVVHPLLQAWRPP